MYLLNTPPPGFTGPPTSPVRGAWGRNLSGGLSLMMPRPNQAVDRGVYYFPTHTTVRSLHGLGQTSLSTPMLLGVLGAVGLGVYFFMGKKSSSKRRVARLASERTRISQQLKQMGA